MAWKFGVFAISKAQMGLVSRFYSGQVRKVPESLLLKQAVRLGKVPAVRESYVTAALADLKGLVGFGGYIEDNDLGEELANKKVLSKKVRDGQFDKLLQNRFGMGADKVLNMEVVCREFPKLTKNEHDLVMAGIAETPHEDWKKVPNCIKQLEYYIGFGPIGPRKNLSSKSETTAGSIPVDFTFRRRSSAVTKKSDTVKKLSSNDLNNWAKTYVNKEFENISQAFSQFVMLGIVVVVLAATVNDFARKQEDEQITVYSV